MTRRAIIKTNTSYFQVEIVKFIKNIFSLIFILRIIFQQISKFFCILLNAGRLSLKDRDRFHRKV